MNDAGVKLLFAQDTLAQAIAPVRSQLASMKHQVALGPTSPAGSASR